MSPKGLESQPRNSVRGVRGTSMQSIIEPTSIPDTVRLLFVQNQLNKTGQNPLDPLRENSTILVLLFKASSEFVPSCHLWCNRVCHEFHMVIQLKVRNRLQWRNLQAEEDGSFSDLRGERDASTRCCVCSRGRIYPWRDNLLE